MIEKQHSDNSKQFFKKILLYIDTTLINATTAQAEDKNKVFVSGLLNIKDAIFSEVVRDNFIIKLNEYFKEEEIKKNKLEKDTNSNQEKE
jgi:hypothetical protein